MGASKERRESEVLSSGRPGHLGVSLRQRACGQRVSLVGGGEGDEFTSFDTCFTLLTKYLRLLHVKVQSL